MFVHGLWLRTGFRTGLWRMGGLLVAAGLTERAYRVKTEQEGQTVKPTRGADPVTVPSCDLVT